MNDEELRLIMLERAAEELRQERETFEQQKQHEERWFRLRLVMGYSAAVLLSAIFVLSSYVLLRADQFPILVVNAAGGALFADALGLVIRVWKTALNPSFLIKLGPTTESRLPAQHVPVRAKRRLSTLAGKGTNLKINDQFRALGTYGKHIDKTLSIATRRSAGLP